MKTKTTRKQCIPSIITLTTDFGYRDHYAAVMKGVILAINPTAQVVDISHAVAPQQILHGALLLAQSFSYFPAGSIHVAVVDPGVGTARRPITISAEHCFFVGPDNGIFSLVYQRISSYTVFELKNPEFFHAPVSATFHGRDIFAPVAAHLSRGVDPAAMGPIISDYHTLPVPKPVVERSGIRGTILYVDGFGNLITNIGRSHLEALGPEHQLNVRVMRTIIQGISPHYQSAAQGNPLAIVGSSDLLEISIREGSARQVLGLREGDPVFVFP